MPGSTGPDLNTYTIPEVMNTDTFAYWRDATNTAAYKLNKLRIYDAADSASIGVTYTSSGIWSSTLVPTILSGHTFTNLVRFTGGLSASTIYASTGSTFAAGVVVIGGLSANAVYASAGSTFAAGVVVAGGLSASRLYALAGSTFAAEVVVIGGLSANSIYASTGSTFAANLMVGLNSVGATLGVCGGVLLYQQSSLRFGAANNNYVALKAPSTVGTSLTWTLPATDGGSGQVLSTDSNCVLGWIPGSPVVTGSVNHILLNDGANGITTARCGTAAFGFALGRLCFPTTNIILGESAFTGSTGCCNTVMGESSMFGSKGSFNTAIGRCVLYGSTGNSNTLIGTNAGRGFSGDNSIGIGSDVFYNSGKLFIGANCINFYSNIAVGASAMSNSNRAFCNIGIGILAAAGLSGCDNTAIGSCALCATSGSNNIAIGTCAQINSNTSGGGVLLGTNLAIGACSQSSMCGCCNIGIGCGTQRQLTGNSSVAIGHGAMCLSTMDNSIAIGTNAMRSSTFTLSGGCPSIAIGECALASSTGHTHTAIGSYAMYNSNGCCNIGIGYCAGANHTSGFINAVAIGYNSRFYASNTVKLGNNASITTITGSIVNNSDCRNKTDVRPTIWGLDFINALRPVDYRWDHRSDYADGTPDGSKKGTRFHSGLLAQEVQAAADATGEDFAGVIHWSHNGISHGPEEFGLKYDYFVAPLIRAVQELSVRVCAEEFRRKE